MKIKNLKMYDCAGVGLVDYPDAVTGNSSEVIHLPKSKAAIGEMSGAPEVFIKRENYRGFVIANEISDRFSVANLCFFDTESWKEKEVFILGDGDELKSLEKKIKEWYFGL